MLKLHQGKTCWLVWQIKKDRAENQQESLHWGRDWERHVGWDGFSGCPQTILSKSRKRRTKEGARPSHLIKKNPSERNNHQSFTFLSVCSMNLPPLPQISPDAALVLWDIWFSELSVWKRLAIFIPQKKQWILGTSCQDKTEPRRPSPPGPHAAIYQTGHILIVPIICRCQFQHEWILAVSIAYFFLIIQKHPVCCGVLHVSTNGSKRVWVTVRVFTVPKESTHRRQTAPAFPRLHVWLWQHDAIPRLQGFQKV